MKNSNEHLVPELEEEVRTRLIYAGIDEPPEEAINSMVALISSHHAHLKERVMELSKKPKCNDTHRAYTDANGFRICGNCSRIGGFNEALDEINKLLE